MVKIAKTINISNISTLVPTTATSMDPHPLVTAAMLERTAAATAAAKKASNATATRNDIKIALKNARDNDGLDKDDAEGFLQHAFGKRLDQVTEYTGDDVDDLVEQMWDEISVNAQTPTF
jgi:hypothetical protein